MKTKALISFAVTAKLICVFVFTYTKIRFSHDEAQLKVFILAFTSLKIAIKGFVIQDFSAISEVQIKYPVPIILNFLTI